MQDNDVDLLDISLQELMNVKVNIATKQTQSATRVPAIVSVITNDDILVWGYQSVAQALIQVPGLYGINDYVGYNYGVRGINGGQRAYSRIIKVMINGIAVPFRSDSTNFLGPELIPIEAVERIEVVRGPGSALYGENAFMGIINVITKTPARSQQNYRLRLGDENHLGMAANLSFKDEQNELTFAVSAESYNNDGLTLPEVSPRFSNFTDTISDNAESTPQSVLFQWRRQSNAISHDLMINYSRLESVAEFLDFGTLSHENNIALTKQHINYKLNWLLNESQSWNLSLGYSQGQPASDERLSLNSDTSFPQRDFEFNVIDFASEFHWQTENNSAYIFGVDYAFDEESIIQVSNIDIATGESTLLSTPVDDVTLKNIGVYMQYIKTLDEDTLLTFNLRSDDHNIYGRNNNYRIGFVKQFSKDVSAKFLVGSSYKAPAAMQLYAQPLYPGEVIGNPDLLAEDAVTLESELSWFVSSELGVTLNLWANEIDNKVELLPSGVNVQPLNSGKQKGFGLESEIKWVREDYSLIANAAYQETDNETDTLFQGTISAPTAMFPKLTSYIRYQYRLNPTDQIAIAAEYVSQRRATNSNIRENLSQPYELNGYTLVNFSYLTSWDEWKFQLNINNLFDERYEEPGFLGIDIPGNPRHWYLNLHYEF